MTGRTTYIRIGLPLPLDVFATLGTLIDKAWPGAAIITDPAKAGVPEHEWYGWRSGHEQLIRVEGVRPKQVSKKTAREVAAANALEDGEEPLLTTGFKEDGSVGMSTPAELQLFLGGICHELIERSEGAINYLEWSLADEDGNRTVLSVARSKGQTPHALRTAAEAKLAAIRELADGWQAEVEDDGNGLTPLETVLTELRAVMAD